MLPTSTYRLQFRNGFGFDEAVAVVPYLKALGISHVYASPVFTATKGSTHGYDVTDHNTFDPAIGGRAGFDRLSAALKAAGLGLILDIVPNHMAASMENPWWRSVAEFGQDSPYARHFDIDWREPLTLPVLGKSFEAALEDGEFKLADGPNGKPEFGYFDNRYPLNPAALEEIAQRGGDLAAHSRDPAFLRRLHEMQAYRLTFWKEARRHLSYRRFFEVTGLAGVRVEDDAVFADVHKLILALVRNGQVDGLRVDHVDGLADPKGYLEKLRAEIGPDTFLVVEKILNGEETLRPDWPIEGTTGYEFTANLADLLVDGDGAAALAETYGKLCDAPTDLETMRRDAKRQMVTDNFETELKGLIRLAHQALASAFDETSIKDALVAITVACPVYRAYVDADGASVEDQALLSEIATTAKAQGGAEPASIDAVIGLLTGLQHDPTVAEFRSRFQQLTGPVTAKAVEDTLFYRYNALIALNEVGSDPAEPVGSVERFHAHMAARVTEQPHGLLGTSTHDTKRGEDARTRLHALSQAPDAWSEAVSRWRDMQAEAVQVLDDGKAPEPQIEWLFYQALAGIWTGARDAASLDALRDRFLPYVEKVLREAKLRTDWTEVNEAYENAVKDYAGRLFTPNNAAFLSDFDRVLAPIIAAGRVNSLTQTLIKLTAPGIPDIYQGTEIDDLSMVDPDNRRPVDFGALAGMLGEPTTSWPSAMAEGRAKLQLLQTGLQLRQDKRDLFAKGGYRALALTGSKTRHALAYLRDYEEQFVMVAAPRLPLGFDGDWSDTAIVMPASHAGRTATNRLTGMRVLLGETISLADLLKDCPVALVAAD